MRRVASSKVFFSRNDVKTNHVLEVYDEHLINHYALDCELEMTDWLGGVMIVTHVEDIDAEGIRTIDDFFDRLESAESTSVRPVVWHISCLNVKTMELSDRSKITRVVSHEYY